MVSDLMSRNFFHGSEYRGGYRLGFDAALRALAPILDPREGREESWSLLGLGGSLMAWRFRCFSVLFDAGASLSCVKAFLMGCRERVLTSYRV